MIYVKFFGSAYVEMQASVISDVDIDVSTNILRHLGHLWGFVFPVGKNVVKETVSS